MSEVEILPPADPFGKWLFETVTGQEGPIRIGIPGTGVMEGAQERIAALFELSELLKSMNENMRNTDAGIRELNENMRNIDAGIRELNENIKTLGLGDFEDGTQN